MKQFFFLIVMVFCTNINAQIYNSNCTAKPLLTQFYKMDAKRLAEVRLQEIDSPFKDSVSLHQPTVDTILQALIRMHNMEWSPLKDTIRNIFQFTDFSKIIGFEPDSTHFNTPQSNTYRPQSIGALQTKVFLILNNFNGAWINQWKAGNFNNTSNAAINNLVDRNNLQISYLGEFGAPFNTNLLRFGITTTLNQNNLALRNTIKAIEPSSEVNHFETTTAQYFFDGNTVIIKINPTFIDIEFSNRCTDCTSGCMQGTSWKFRLPFNNCTVEYIGRSYFGNWIPNPLFCFRGALVNIGISNFYIQTQENKNKLVFTSNQNNDVLFYDIERSTNGVEFNSIEKLMPTTSTKEVYQLDDKNVTYSKALFYRIKTVKKDGSKLYSTIVKAERNFVSNLNIVTNSNTKNIQLNFSNEFDSKNNICIYNNLGIKVWQTSYSLQKGLIQLPINLSNQFKGIYIVKIENQTQQLTKNFILN